MTEAGKALESVTFPSIPSNVERDLLCVHALSSNDSADGAPEALASSPAVADSCVTGIAIGLLIPATLMDVHTHSALATSRQTAEQGTSFTRWPLHFGMRSEWLM